MDLVESEAQQPPLFDKVVRSVHHRLDELEAMLQDTPATVVDTSEMLKDIEVLRVLLGQDATVAALAITTVWRLDRKIARFIDPRSRGGKARSFEVQRRDWALVETALEECPRLFAKSASAAAEWLIKNGKTELPKERVRKILGKYR